MNQDTMEGQAEAGHGSVGQSNKQQLGVSKKLRNQKMPL